MTSNNNEISLKFDIIDVFTSTKYLGNPLAIVQVPTNLSITQMQKQTIAREFNLSETVFLHESPFPSDNTNTSTSEDSGFVKIDIFTTDAELPFAGHPTIGTSWYLLSGLGSISTIGNRRDNVTLKTLAGLIPATRQEGTNKVQLEVPTDYKEHSPIQLDSFKSAQHQLKSEDYVNGLEGDEAVVSIVKGMTFILLKLNSEDALARLKIVAQNIEVPWLGEWQGLVGVYAFYEMEDGVIRTRMLMGALEDPATGSAASTLGGYLGRKKGVGKWKLYIVQGVEINRRSDIEVQVEIGEDHEIRKIELAGEAVGVMSGSIVIPS